MLHLLEPVGVSGRMFGEAHRLQLCGDHHEHKNNVKCGMLKLHLGTSSQSASIVEAKDIGQRSVHILQD